jgi:hypothetical protein
MRPIFIGVLFIGLLGCGAGALALSRPSPTPGQAYIELQRQQLALDQARDDHAGNRTLVYGAALLVAGVVLVFLAEWHADRRRQRELLYPDQYGHYPLVDPRHFQREVAAELALRLYQGQFIALQEAARASQVLPVHYAPHITVKDAPRPALAQQEPRQTVEQLPVAGLPTAPTWQQLRSDGWVPSAEQMLLGYGVNGPIYGGIEALLSTAIAGRPKQGKTTLLRFIYAQVILAGGQIIIMDPHGSIADAIEGGPALWIASSAGELADGAAWLQVELDQRNAAYQSGQRKFTPLLALCDEWPVISMACKPAVEATSRVVLEARKWGVYGLFSGQGLPAEKFGGSLMRDALSSRYVFKTTAAQARMAGLDKESSYLVQTLEPGRAVLDGPINPEVVAIPDTTGADLLRLIDVTSRREVDGSRGGSGLEVSVEVGSNEPLPGLSYALDARSERVKQLLRQKVSQNEILKDVWGVNSGGGRAYQEAAEQYRELVAQLVG